MPTDQHISPDLLAAFCERAATKEEAAAVFVHLAECPRCREWADVHSQFRIRPRRRPASFLKAAPALACALAVLWLIASHLVTPHSVRERPGRPESVLPPRRQLEFTTLRTFRENGIPFPLASARLNSNLSFLQEPDRSRVRNRIALKTAFGEKWIALENLGKEIRF